MNRCIIPSDGPFGLDVSVTSMADAAMDGITAQDFLGKYEMLV